MLIHLIGIQFKRAPGQMPPIICLSWSKAPMLNASSGQAPLLVTVAGNSGLMVLII